MCRYCNITLLNKIWHKNAKYYFYSTIYISGKQSETFPCRCNVKNEYKEKQLALQYNG